jgi:hypothetical protein
VVPLFSAAQAAGPDSHEQQQLFCVLVSLIKVLTHARSGSLGAPVRNSNASCALALNVMRLMLQPSQTAVPAAATTSAPAAIILTLPWLVLLGRCCLFVEEQLTTGGAVREAPSNIVLTSPDSDASALQNTHEFLQQVMEAVPTMHPFQLFNKLVICAGALTAADSWLQHSSSNGTVSAQLAAAGYITGDLQSQIQQAVDAIEAAAAAGVQSGRGTAHAADSVGLASSSLTAVGQALTSLPIPDACNNPACMNLTKLSEVQLVNGKSACVVGAVWPTTAAGPASASTGSSTSLRARRCKLYRPNWQQELYCPHVHNWGLFCSRLTAGPSIVYWRKPLCMLPCGLAGDVVVAQVLDAVTPCLSKHCHQKVQKMALPCCRWCLICVRRAISQVQPRGARNCATSAAIPCAQGQSASP